MRPLFDIKTIATGRAIRLCLIPNGLSVFPSTYDSPYATGASTMGREDAAAVQAIVIRSHSLHYPHTVLADFEHMMKQKVFGIFEGLVPRVCGLDMSTLRE